MLIKKQVFEEMSNPAAEKYLKQVRKLPSNLHCPNCGSESSTNLGFGNVCVKYKTFICDLCKTSHQAISHRVKSVSMSSWTMDEVKELTSERSGGNAAALHTWLLNAPAVGHTYSGGKRPKKGDDVSVFKQFIVDCYEHGKFRADTPFDPSTVVEEITSPAGSAATSPRPTGASVSSAPRAHPSAVPFRRVTSGGSGTTPGPALVGRPAPRNATSAAAPVAEMNLLDMSDLDAPMPTSNPNIASSSGSQTLSVDTDDFFSTASNGANNNNNNNNNSREFDAFNSPNPNIGDSSNNTDFDSMFGAASSAPAPPVRGTSVSSAPVAFDVFSSDPNPGQSGGLPQRSVSAPLDPFADFGSGCITTGPASSNGTVNKPQQQSVDFNSMIFGGGNGGISGSSSSSSISSMGMSSVGSHGMGMNGMGNGMNRSNGNMSISNMGMGNGNMAMNGGFNNSSGMSMSMSSGMGMGMGMGNSNASMNMNRSMGSSIGSGSNMGSNNARGSAMSGGSMSGRGMGSQSNNAATPLQGVNNNMSSMMNNQLLGMNSMKSNSYMTAHNQSRGQGHSLSGGYGGSGKSMNSGANSNVFDFVNNEMKKK